jgi:hypothetical protein
MSELTLSEIILNARPESKPSSVKAYERILNKFINMPDNLGGVEWVENYEEIEKFIGDLKLAKTTERNYYVALMIYVEGINGGKFTDKWQTLPEYETYKNKVDFLNNEYKKAKEEKGATEKQLDNMVPREDILKALEGLIPEIRKIRSGLDWSSGGGAVNKENSRTFMCYVLAMIYMEMPVRNEIANLKVIGQRDYNKLIKNATEPIRDNFLIVRKDVSVIARHKYKTSDQYGSVETPLPKSLRPLINAWIKYRNVLEGEDKYLFPDLQPMPGSKSSTAELNLTKTLQRFFKKLIGKEISTTILAKIKFQSLVDKKSLDNLKEASAIRGTSLGTAGLVYANGE